MNTRYKIDITTDQWKLVFEAVRKHFELSDILPEQRKSIKAYSEGKDIFDNLPTSFEKALILQCLPIVVLVNSPLRSNPETI